MATPNHAVFIAKSAGQAGPGQFVQDLYKGVLPINELAKSVGLNLPQFLGTPTPPEKADPKSTA